MDAILIDDRKRLEIAEACGWYDFGTRAPERGQLAPRIIGRDKEQMERRVIPDYLNDLNAMHEAEKTLTGKQMAAYADNLNRTTPLGGWMIVATARQRAEAFLLTINADNPAN